MIVIKPGESVTVRVPLNAGPHEVIETDVVHRGPIGSEPPKGPHQWQAQDISREVFGRYQHCTLKWGLWYSDDDFLLGNGIGPLRWGAIPATRWGGATVDDRRPWRGVLVELIRRVMGAKREW